MKRFNLYVNKNMYDIESEEQLYPDLKSDVKREVERLDIGDSYAYKNIGHSTEWEIERIA